jgi:hypothetical protein
VAVLRVSEPETMEQEAKEIRDFGPSSPSLQMQFVEDEIEIRIVIRGQPPPCRLEQGLVYLSIQHCAQHADVGDEDVGRVALHVPPGQEFRAIDRRKQESAILVKIRRRVSASLPYHALGSFKLDHLFE